MAKVKEALKEPAEKTGFRIRSKADVAFGGFVLEKGVAVELKAHNLKDRKLMRAINFNIQMGAIERV